MKKKLVLVLAGGAVVAGTTYVFRNEIKTVANRVLDDLLTKVEGLEEVYKTKQEEHLLHSRLMAPE